ncbi:NADPH-dependent FMN reductase [Streptomyces sp. NPDC059893]|uniref:NADPH-dependent FMN reductase n=1 Tax=Streptomyces sp. NPDC059893 TaxID=3346990 RepID=UPI00364AD36B
MGGEDRLVRRVCRGNPRVQPQHHRVAEWNNKAIGFISYGPHGGIRAVEHLRVMAGELMMADVRAQVSLPFATEFENYRTFKPGDYNLPVFNTMLDQVIAWSQALMHLRAEAVAG